MPDRLLQGLLFTGLAAAFALIAAVGALSFDFACLPGYDKAAFHGWSGKGALAPATLFALQNLPALLPILAGFLLIFAVGFGLPLLMPADGLQRRIVGFAVLPLILGTVAWIVLAGPGNDCTVNAVSPRLLRGAAIGASVLLAFAWMSGRILDRR